MLKRHNRPNVQVKRFPKQLCLSISLISSALFSTSLFAQTFSYNEAEQYVVENAYASQAQQALQQASQLEMEAVKHLGLPRIDLNATAYSFHSETSVPLESSKRRLENSLTRGFDDKLSQWENVLPPDVIDQVGQGFDQVVSDGLNKVPNNVDVTIKDHDVRTSISMVMPLYTGGKITSAKQIATIQAQRSNISEKQQQDSQRFEMIQSYFNVQLQQQLLNASLFNLNAMQEHYNNALKLEQQGFINKGQRMQFEVARNNAERTYQNAKSNLRASEFSLQNLLKTKEDLNLTTPLFVNNAQSQSLDKLLANYDQNSSLIKKLKMDTELANENIKIQQSAKKPSVFAFGEYGLDSKENWIVGVMAKYNLFSGIDNNKNIRAAELKKYAAELMTERTKQEVENVLYKSYSELNSSQTSHQLLTQNIKAAQENLRIQQLSFKEGMGTATQVIDAQNALSALKSEMSINAYKYILSLATLLQSYGSIDEFKLYVNQPRTDYIR
ncbi:MULTISPECIES: TolC family protein [Acinetobacter]|jgi:outer membrane protein TolC|uniref:TolC family protein n=1 Tax=Acinetobacter TaxID=469 RepID=UPI000C5F86BA|nr:MULTISPECIES: TolC family protein [Acinetobacter]MBC70025.1 transporter [Acinetobacter sp.]MBT50345.1 transporter [Acinetobacter sp.]HIQ33981.1 TolC family protein [Acinetobacter venetianus]HJP46247.1 TolC family protein [Acinetobacter venetianus]|tara:strand:- start:673 stop:2169 length:1497 start_codon:yes stop_codon:yes gene_type:complete